MSTSAAAATCDHGLAVGDIDQLRISVVRAPHLSVLQWLISAGAPRAHSAFASSVALATPPGAARVLRALGGPGLGEIPEYLIPLAPARDTTVAENLIALRESPASALAEQVARWGRPAPAAWQSAVEQPAAWRDDFASATQAAWSTGKRLWEGNSRSMDREIARIGTAVVCGAVPALLNSLHPRIAYRDGMVWFRNSCPSIVPLGGRRLVLVPLLAPQRRVVVSFERDDVAYIAYPVSPGRASASTTDRLELVLGQLRAAALRRLAVPTSMQILAGEIHCAASTVTYHCDLLESAGLIARERRGSAMYAIRTPAGDTLVDLLS